MAGEIENEGGVLVLRRIHVHYKLRVPDPDEVRDTVARVLEMHVGKCPIAKSLEGAIEITTDVEFV